VVTGDIGEFLLIHRFFPLPGLLDPFSRKDVVLF